VDVENMSDDDRGAYALSVKNRQMSLASAFRDRMTKGQSFKDPNKYRQDFYKDVIKLAEEVNFQTFTVFERMTVSSSSRDTVNYFIGRIRAALVGTFLKTKRGWNRQERSSVVS
jgi:hypothetical protein